MLIALGTAKAWSIQQMDINNTFLHGRLNEKVYMNIPEGYAKGKQGQVCKLHNSLYGLKQASHEWNAEFSNKLKQISFNQSHYYHCLFMHKAGNDLTYLYIWTIY